jgi:hypothetical protein
MAEPMQMLRAPGPSLAREPGCRKQIGRGADQGEHDHAEEDLRQAELAGRRFERAGDQFRLERDGRRRADQDEQRDPERPSGVPALHALVGREHVAVRDQRVDEIGAVEQQQDGGDADAQLLVAQREPAPVGVRTGCEIEHSRKQECDDREYEEARKQASTLALETQFLAPDPADDDRNPQPEQGGAYDGARNLGANHVGLAPGQDEDRQDELGDAAEADVEQSADRLTEVRGNMLGRPPHPVGQHGDGHGARQEHGNRRAAIEELERRRDRQCEQKQEGQPDRVHRARSGVIGCPRALATCHFSARIDGRALWFASSLDRRLNSAPAIEREPGGSSRPAGQPSR